MPTEIDVIVADLSKEILQKRHEIAEERGRLDTLNSQAFAQLQGLKARIEGIHFMYNQMPGVAQRDPKQQKEKKQNIVHVNSRIQEKEKEIKVIESNMRDLNRKLDSLKKLTRSFIPRLQRV